MGSVEDLVANYLRHAQVDYVGLWQIVGRVRDELGVQSDADARQNTLAVVRGLVEQGLRPGDYLKSGFHYWPESDPDSVVARIDREWQRMGRDPDLPEPICWFAPKA